MIDNSFKFTITLYNKYVERLDGRNVTKWKRTVLNECYFGTETVKQLNGNVLSQADSFVCRIPQSKAYTDSFKGERDKFTLKPDDIIVKGNITDEIADVQGMRITDLMQKYKGSCFTVRAVSDNTLLEYAPHYRASGV